jgi:oxygen-independent coproporphyrinogen-3 oxidase
MVDAILQEAAMKRSTLVGPAESVYFGGGTPSLLEPEEITFILEGLHKMFDVTTHAEVTLEANPDDINSVDAARWKSAGINRISLGIQSFSDEELQWMHRTHNSQKALDSLRDLRQAGFENISADLIFGSPKSTEDSLKNSLDILLKESIPHLSCYALTIENGTPLKKKIEGGLEKPTDDNLQASQFLTIMEVLTQNGYEHYEISNFAKPGCRSRHNSSYWKGTPYLGLGPSAHSYDGQRRRSFNVANNNIYLEKLAAGEDPGEYEMLTDKDMMNEFIMIHLRRAEGLDLNLFEDRFGKIEAGRVEQEAISFIRNGWAEMDKRILTLTREGKLLADGMASALFSV